MGGGVSQNDGRKGVWCCARGNFRDFRPIPHIFLGRADKESLNPSIERIWGVAGGRGPEIGLERTFLGHTPSTAGTFRNKFRGKNSRKISETLSERFLESPSRVRLGSPKPFNSRHLRLPEHFQNSLPPIRLGTASFFRSGSGKGLYEPVMEFLAELGERKKKHIKKKTRKQYFHGIVPGFGFFFCVCFSPP